MAQARDGSAPMSAPPGPAWDGEDPLRAIARRVIVLDHGRIVLDGQTADVVSAYLDDVERRRA